MPPAPPLAVDLDGTLALDDTTGICMGLLWRDHPWQMLGLPLWLWRGRAYAKREMARRVELDPSRLRYHGPFLDFLRQERAQGRLLVLATGSDQKVADRVAGHLGIFQEVFASDGQVNLTSSRKAAALVARFGERGFDYAGNHHKDLPAWRLARHAILVNCPQRLVAQVQAEGLPHTVFPPPDA